MKKLGILTAIALLAALLGHRWLRLGWQARRYPVAAPADRTRAVVSGGRAYFAAGVEGIEVVDLSGSRPPLRVAPPAPADRIDDLCLDGERLFALDATPPGHLLALSLADPDRLVPIGDPVPVPVGPFSGVSVASGLVVVSGGTSQLTLREVNASGRFGSEVAAGDFGRGQPDVILRPDGAMAAISTHLYGPEFAMTFVAIERRPLRLRQLGQIRLRDAGFTSGGYKPAHFPLVAAWRGDRVYVAEGGGLDAIDLSVPSNPRLLLHDRAASPAIDLALSGDQLLVLRAGSKPAVLRYRFDAGGVSAAPAIWNLPAEGRPAGVAFAGSDALLTRLGRGWLRISESQFTPLQSVP